MPQIILTPEQLSLYQQAEEPVQVYDPQGNKLGTLPPAHSVEFIAALKRRAASQGPWYTGDDIQAMFRFLEDAEARDGKIDEQRLSELLDVYESQRGRSS